MHLLDLHPMIDLKAPVPPGTDRARGDRLAVPAVHQGVPARRRVDRRQRRPPARLARRQRPRRRHDRRLHLRPGILPRRPRLVRQADDVRGIGRDAVAGADIPRSMAASGVAGRCGVRRHGAQRRLRRDVPRPRRRRRARRVAGPELRPVAARRDARRLAHLDVLPVLDAPRRLPPGARALRGAHPHAQADRLLQRPARPARAPTARSTRPSGSCTTSSPTPASCAT